mgnify:CR=1 FL=1
MSAILDWESARIGDPAEDISWFLQYSGGKIDYRKALEMVVRGRLDVAVLPERQGDRLLRETGLVLRKQPWRLAGERAYLVLSRRSPWLARQAELERALRSVLDSVVVHPGSTDPLAL